MKVALLTDCYLPRLGGIEVQVHDLARHLHAAGHQVEVLTATRSHRMRTGLDTVDGIPVHRMAMPLPGQVPINPMAVPAMRRLLRTGGFDVAHAHMGVVSPFAMDAVRVALSEHVPTAITWHCVHGRATAAMRTAGYAARWARRGAVLSAVSAAAAEPVAAMTGGPPVQIVPNGIDVQAWAPRPRPERTTVQVVSAMRLAPRKRPLALLDIVAQARRQAPGADLRLTVLGEGPLRGRLERSARARDATSWFRAPGRMTREQLREHYLAADVYVAPARLEAFGIAALEARTTGLPVVAPRRSGVSEFVEHDVNGLLVGDDRGMAEALAQLARDATLRRRITAYNEHHPPRQTWPFVVGEAVREYERAIAHAGGQ